MANYFIDRVVEHPGRVSITPVAGESSFATAEINGTALNLGSSSSGVVADVLRAEGTVTEAGTPLNAENLNGGINSMIEDSAGELVRACVISPMSTKQLTSAAGREYIVVWTGQGTTGSRGVDYVWSDGTVTSRSVSLTGTALLHYGGNDEYLVLENTASSTTIHAMVIGAPVTAA